MTDCGDLSFREVYEGSYDLDHAAVHPLYPSLRFLTAPINCGIEENDGEAFGRMLRQARHKFRYIFLDAPAGVDAGFRLVSAAADRFLVVTGAGPAAVRDAARVGELLELQGERDVRMIVNRVNKSMMSLLRLTIDEVMDRSGLPLIGMVLEDDAIPLAAACNLPLVRFNKRAASITAYKKIAKRIQGLPEPITLR